MAPEMMGGYFPQHKLSRRLWGTEGSEEGARPPFFSQVNNLNIHNKALHHTILSKDYSWFHYLIFDHITYASCVQQIRVI